MNRPPLLALSILCISGTLVPSLRAQDTSTPAPSQAPSTEQTGSSQSTSKKVWTNEDVPDLREDSAISTVGSNGRNGARPTPANSHQATGRKDAKWYSDQIARLQGQIAPIDAQIAKIQDAINGKPTGDSHTSSRPTGVKAGSWQDEIDQLQKKRAEIQTHIQELEIQAHRDGVPANQLP